MKEEEAIVVLYQILQKRGLEQRWTNLQEQIFRQCWTRKDYGAIAESLQYDRDYVRKIGAQLWKLLSQALDTKVTKSNFISLLERYAASSPSAAVDPKLVSPPQQHWGTIPDNPTFYGRTAELEQLKTWVLTDNARFIQVVGMGGMGKTSLVAKLTQQIEERFEFVYWQSLDSAPPFPETIAHLLRFLSGQSDLVLPQTTQEQISLLISYLAQARCLLIFDNSESLLFSAADLGKGRAGDYADVHQDYGQLWHSVATATHNSCLLSTSREKIKGLELLTGEQTPVRLLQLTGIEPAAAQSIFQERGEFIGTTAEWQTVIQHYGGNPLALKMVATVILDVFGNNLAEFITVLRQGIFIFEDMRQLLERQFSRLSPAEAAVMYWLGIQPEAVSPATLNQQAIDFEYQVDLIEVLRSLARRSLIEKRATGFTLQPVVREYTIRELLENIKQELETLQLHYFLTHPLLQATAKIPLQKCQRQRLLNPILAHLSQTCESPQGKLDEVLAVLKQDYACQLNYGAGNLLNLFIALNVDLEGYDFSELTIWEVNLQQVKLQGVNLSQSDVTRSFFTEGFSEILSLSYSQDGTLLVTGDTRGNIILRRVTDNHILQHFHQQGRVWSVLISPDGRTLITGGIKQKIQVWDLATGTCRQVLTSEPQITSIYAISLHPDGQTLVSGGGDATVKLWDLPQGTCRQTLVGHTDRVHSVQFSPDGKTIISGSADCTVKWWDAETGACLQTLVGSEKGIWSVVFSPDGQTVASAGYDPVIRLWDLSTGQCRQRLSGHRFRLISLAFSPDGRYLASGGDDDHLRIWEVASGHCLKRLQGHGHRVFAVVFNPQQPRYLATGGRDQQLLIWDTETGQPWRNLKGYSNSVWSIASHPQQPWLASGGEDGWLRLWDLQTGDCWLCLDSQRSCIWHLAFSPQGDRLATSHSDFTVRIWQWQTQAWVQTLPIPCLPSHPLAFNPTGEKLVVGGDIINDAYGIYLWDLTTGHLQQTLVRHQDVISAFAFAPHSPLLASGSYDRTILLWHPETGECLSQLQGHDGIVWSLAFHPQASLLASASEDHTLKLWDVSTGEMVQTLSGHLDGVLGVKFSPQGNWLVSGSRDHTVRLWDIETGECIQTFLGHTNRVWSVDFSYDGKRVISGSLDWTIKIWDISTGNCLRTLQPPLPYAGMRISGIQGLSPSAIAILKMLGAVA